ncbi:MAG: polymorphic toxin-type HINT domain-containing protein [Pirellulaceae bacterium]
MTPFFSLRRCLALFLFGAITPVFGLAEPPTREPADDEADLLVRSALRFESQGDAQYRRIMLDLALHRFPDFAPARWHAGFVRDGERWCGLSDFEAAREKDPLLAEYAERSRKAFAEESAEKHLILGRWCLRRGLADQSRYHLAQVFRLPASAELLQQASKHLAFELLKAEGAAGLLVGKEERQRRQEEAERASKAWRAWAPELTRIAVAMTDPDERQRRAALEELEQIEDPDAVAALESIVSPRGEEHALAVVQVLSGIAEHEATMSLARHAIFSESRPVRESAARRLAGRPIHDYAPWLLARLVSPVKSRFWIQPLPGGSFHYLHDFYREDARRQYVMRQDTKITAAPDLVFLRGFGNPNPAEATVVDPPDPLIPPKLMALNILAKATEKQGQVLQHNRQAEAINKRIDAVLELGTGQKMNADPVRWWQWWEQYNELQAPDEKQLVSSFSNTRFTYPTGGYVVKYIPSCFPEGTTVWTECGARPIEAIRGGVRVLAQDVETGKLEYKTVIGTTTRPPTPLLSLTAGDDTIRATKGHPFWVCGEGWKMAKFLNVGDRLHCAAGLVTIEAITEAEPEPAYNLIVEDFATYFVGARRLLVHDNTLRAPTTAKVPGLHEN